MECRAHFLTGEKEFDMSFHDLLDQISRMESPSTVEPQVPSPAIVGFFVRWVRGLHQWKKATLASFAGVSLSTIERVERGEKVSDENLDRIATALGYGAGYFTTPRIAIPMEDAVNNVVEMLERLRPVPVSPMRSQRKIREAAQCESFIAHHPGLSDELKSQVADLIEWLDLASFIINSPEEGGEPKLSRRKLYRDILACVRGLESQGLVVLSGVLTHEKGDFAGWKTAIISVTQRRSDPAAEKREHVFVDARWSTLQNQRSVDG
jgi:transcriptional regulator with XRE-family HTH domain